ncbi:FUSC family protein [Nocardiopsis trehalosi]|jgi:uncharacterized membrane protein YgaE (UPF0421/DUF939 family)|uniref:FUSC family protein n=1 Tax=Nocardiopsis trehalosi TaxID=109329 RepID=UPI000837A667|nr:aromatic acid exporter family protein [Nocardiopsis trehalosi]
MTTGATARRRAPGQGRVDRARQWARRAVRADGHERHTVLLIAKSTIAACAAWAVAYYGLQAKSPAFAPFSAVLIMNVTVYQSVAQALRYILAVAAGVALQGVFGFLAGPDLLTFALVAATALIIGRWPPLGSQGTQVATAAFFAFSTYLAATTTADRFTQLGQIVLLVLIGCGIGVLVNVVLLPPMRFRSAEYGVQTLASSLCGLLDDMAPALRDDVPDAERTGQWRTRAEQAERLVPQARTAVRTAQESAYYNPRLLLRRNRRNRSFSGYEAVAQALERVSYQMVSLTRSLDQWSEDEPSARHRAFLGAYGDFLAAMARLTRIMSELDEDRLAAQARELCEAADGADECLSTLVERSQDIDLPLTDHTRPYGLLLVEARRLMDEFRHTCDVLRQVADGTAR